MLNMLHHESVLWRFWPHSQQPLWMSAASSCQMVGFRDFTSVQCTWNSEDWHRNTFCYAHLNLQKRGFALPNYVRTGGWAWQSNLGRTHLHCPRTSYDDVRLSILFYQQLPQKSAVAQCSMPSCHSLCHPGCNDLRKEKSTAGAVDILQEMCAEQIKTQEKGRTDVMWVWRWEWGTSWTCWGMLRMRVTRTSNVWGWWGW